MLEYIVNIYPNVPSVASVYEKMDKAIVIPLELSKGNHGWFAYKTKSTYGGLSSVWSTYDMGEVIESKEWTDRIEVKTFMATYIFNKNI